MGISRGKGGQERYIKQRGKLIPQKIKANTHIPLECNSQRPKQGKEEIKDNRQASQAFLRKKPE